MAGRTPKEIVLTAIAELFDEGDLTALDRHWSKEYIQHNPQAPNDTGGLRDLLTSGANVTYEVGLVVAEGDLVVLHGRYTGLGPKPVVAVDILRVVDGKIGEHWDVLQEEITDTVSGNPMFDPGEAR